MLRTQMEQPTDIHDRLDRARGALPPDLLGALDDAGVPGYLVGGALRDAVGGLAPLDPDIDVAVEGELAPVLDRLGVEGRTYERFGTATAIVEGRAIDLARTRRESYSRPGALPDVEPASIDEDLARRDFTINAMALPLTGEPELLDPYGGAEDLAAGRLRLLHPGSLVDDPTRALRGARYAARLGLEPDDATSAALAQTDLTTVSEDRVTAELWRIGAEAEAVAAFGLLDAWGVLEIAPECMQLLAEAAEYALTEPWSRLVQRPRLLAAIATAQPELLAAASELAELDPSLPASQLFEQARHHTDLELAIARAKGADWLDRHVSEWRRVRLTIDGDALIAAGVAEGPDVGRGLRAALHARLEGAIGATPEEELGVALGAVRAR